MRGEEVDMLFMLMKHENEVKPCKDDRSYLCHCSSYKVIHTLFDVIVKQENIILQTKKLEEKMFLDKVNALYMSLINHLNRRRHVIYFEGETIRRIIMPGEYTSEYLQIN